MLSGRIVRSRRATGMSLCFSVGTGRSAGPRRPSASTYAVLVLSGLETVSPIDTCLASAAGLPARYGEVPFPDHLEPGATVLVTAAADPTSHPVPLRLSIARERLLVENVIGLPTETVGRDCIFWPSPVRPRSVILSESPVTRSSGGCTSLRVAGRGFPSTSGRGERWFRRPERPLSSFPGVLTSAAPIPAQPKHALSPSRSH